MKKTLTYLFLVGVSFLVGLPALAWTLQQLQVDTNFDRNNSLAGAMTQTWTAPVTGVVTSLQIASEIVSGGDSTCNVTIGDIGSGARDTGSNYFALQNGHFNALGDQTYVFPTTSPFTVVAGQQYRFTGINCGGAGRVIRVYGASSDVYSGGQFGTSTDRGTTMHPTAVADELFIMQLQATNLSVDFYNRYNPIPDFNNWILQFGVPSAQSSTAITDYKVGVQYYEDGVYGEDYGYFTASAIAAGIAKIPKYHDFSVGEHITSTAVIIDTFNDQILASSTAYSFTITTGTKNDYVAWGTTLSTSSPVISGASCDGVSGFWDKAVCYTFRGLFEPSDTSFSRLISIKDQIANKPPFGYISIYQNALTGITTSSATTSVDFSPVTNLSLLASIRSILSWIFYFLFAIWIIKRLGKFSLHG